MEGEHPFQRRDACGGAKDLVLLFVRSFVYFCVAVKVSLRFVLDDVAIHGKANRSFAEGRKKPGVPASEQNRRTQVSADFGNHQCWWTKARGSGRFFSRVRWALGVLPEHERLLVRGPISVFEWEKNQCPLSNCV